MPIRPDLRRHYTRASGWDRVRTAILARAKDCCEICGVQNYSMRMGAAGHPVRIVLTIAHLDHDPVNNDQANLRAMCQLCHNRYDAKHRAESRRKRG